MAIHLLQLCEPTPKCIHVLYALSLPSPYTAFCSSNSLKVKCVDKHFGWIIAIGTNIYNDSYVIID